MSGAIVPLAVGARFGAAASAPRGAPEKPVEGLGPPRDPAQGGRPARRVRTRSRRGFAVGSVLPTVLLGSAILATVLGLAVPAIIRAYFAHLDAQALARLRPLPRSLRDEWQSLYPGVDLARVRYAEGIDTVHGKGITVGLRIYFPRTLDLETPADRHWMAHELQHCAQYGGSGRVGAFLRTYFSQVAGQVIASRSFDVHDRLGLEVEAEEKAAHVAPVSRPWAVRLGSMGPARPGRAGPPPPGSASDPDRGRPRAA